MHTFSAIRAVSYPDVGLSVLCNNYALRIRSLPKCLPRDGYKTRGSRADSMATSPTICRFFSRLVGKMTPDPSQVSGITPMSRAICLWLSDGNIPGFCMLPSKKAFFESNVHFFGTLPSFVRAITRLPFPRRAIFC
jgi:hypothetical protein